MKHLDKKSITKILSAIASGEKLETVATKFNVSELSVGNIVRGETHTDITGLVKGQAGVKYLKDNAEKFVITKKLRSTPVKPVTPVDGTDTPSDVEPTPTDTEVKAKSSSRRKSKGADKIESTTRKTTKAKTVAPKNSEITIVERSQGVISQATLIVSECQKEVDSIDSNIETKLREIETMRASRVELLAERDKWHAIIGQINGGVNVL